MRSLCKITDDCLKMKPYEFHSWEDWWEKIIKNSKVPSRKTYAFEKFVRNRLELKDSINKELEKRKKPERLICLGVGKGIYLANEKDIAEITIDKHVRKVVRDFERSNKDYKALSVCERISTEDSRMLIRMSNVIELQQNTMIGTMARMKSLPPATKKRLLKKLGVESKKGE